MDNFEVYMRRCLQLAQMGAGHTSPNPMVGCVIVYQNKIIGEGYHTQAGKPHAEVMAIQSVLNKEIIKKATLFVNLEPCSHYGKTPPCSHLIVNMGIKKVVVCNLDPNPLVAGNGINYLRKHGVDVVTGILAEYGAWLNRRFFTFYTKKRPYIILKWAQTSNHYIDLVRNSFENALKITGVHSNILVHKWRTEEDAILIGKNTLTNDNPKLTARHVFGKNPLPFILSSTLVENTAFEIFKNPKFKVFSSINELIKFSNQNQILSVLVEGGAQTLHSFLKENMWDEIRVFTAPIKIQNGIKAPDIQSLTPCFSQQISDDWLHIYLNKATGFQTQPTIENL